MVFLSGTCVDCTPAHAGNCIASRFFMAGHERLDLFPAECIHGFRRGLVFGNLLQPSLLGAGNGAHFAVRTLVDGNASAMEPERYFPLACDFCNLRALVWTTGARRPIAHPSSRVLRI